MADPRLNSVHLEFPRREEFRRARDVLLNARGWQTVLAEQKDLAVEHPNTIIHNERGQAPAGLRYWLVGHKVIYHIIIGFNTVLRVTDNEWVKQDAIATRRHYAILSTSGNAAEFNDTASKNATFLNGSKIAGPTHPRTGDEIRMCDPNLIFVPPEDDVPPSPAHTITHQ